MVSGIKALTAMYRAQFGGKGGREELGEK